MAKKRVNPRRIPAKVTEADIEKWKKIAREQAVSYVFGIFFTVLRDKEGYGVKRLDRVWSEVNKLSEEIEEGRVDLDDLLVTLREEANIYLASD